MNKRIWFGLILAAVALVITGLLWRSQPQEHDTVMVGAILPLTGPAAAFGRSSQNAVTLALSDLKTLHPEIHMDVLFEDSVADPKIALSAFERLYRFKGCRVFMSSVSSVTLALIPAIKRNDLVLFANAAHPDVTKNGGHVFRYSNTADSEAQVIADFLSGTGFRRIFCLASNDDYGKIYVAELVRLSARARVNFGVVGSDFYGQNITDFRTILAKAQNLMPDMFVFIGLGHAQGLAIRQLREGGFTGPFIASLGFVVTPEALEAAGEAMRGGYFLNYVALSDPRIQALRNRYIADFGEDPSPSIILDYGFVFILADAATNSRDVPGSLRSQLQRQDTFETPIGILEKTKGGDIVAPVRIQKVSPMGTISLWSSE